MTTTPALERDPYKAHGGQLGNHRRWHVGRGITKAGCPWCEREAAA